ncbi:fatty-acyl coenzyme A oxidase [Dimargaris verticillata]|uniref:Acyl-coenzyme A oxidase n=1 Tax=Dimargaris verticillata TaxID=2761393 RepID=A0A9W8B4Y1_9FUNG|nr:fatty-acyl coenzyme A oxidase [Dimargaris verticillata]
MPQATKATAPTPSESLAQERQHASFPIRGLTYLLEDGQDKAEFKERAMFQLERDPLWRMDNTPDLSLVQVRERTMAKAQSLVHYLEMDSVARLQQRMSLISVVDPAFWTRMGVHYGLFLGAVQGQATPEQLSYWVNKGALNLNGTIGCFGMTELGHGSNVAGLETTATFDETADEFVIHTPSITATKWWIGGAAHSATHCAVYAQLWVKGKCHGVKTFVVPLRDPKTYRLLPGVTIGDLGKKMGRDGIDNGWIQFTHVRIPRSFMLMKHTKVTRTGEVHQPAMAQLAYGALIQGRVYMVADSGNMSKKALTIAIRYAAIRRQFASKPDQPETKLLDYPIHQYRLLPLLAQAYAMTFTGNEMLRLYRQLMTQIESTKEGSDMSKTLEMLKETHATSAGLKAFCTWNCLHTIEQCRQSLGGHGYSGYTGLASMYQDFAVQCTWEGDNTILTLQCGRYLVSSLRGHRKGKLLPKNIEYLARASQSITPCRANTAQEILSLETILDAWGAVAANAVAVATAEFEDALAAGASTDAAYEQCSAQRLRAAKMHCYGYLTARFNDAIARAQPELRPILTKLCLLYGSYSINEHAGEFLQSGFFTSQHMTLIRKGMYDLLKAIRPEAVPLVDAFNYTDYVINSPLGRYDGNIYEAYFDLVKKNNPKHNDIPYFESIIKPLLNRTPNADSGPDLKE